MTAKSIGPIWALQAFALVCTPAPVTLDSIRAAYTRDEFLPSHGIGADGWAEARRRQMLKSYFRSRGLRYSETPVAQSKPGKYRDVSLECKGKAASGILKISLALKPEKSGQVDAQFKLRQQQCDRRLFSLLQTLDTQSRQWSGFEFSVTEDCLDLTTQLRLED